MSTAQDRDALYYPYIHIRDVNHLKATLLCFPQVRRMVPPGFDLDDKEEVRPFLEIEGPRRGAPLLDVESTNQSVVYSAQMRLLERIREHEDFLVASYSEEHAKAAGQWDTFEMHRGKMRDLLGWLEEKDLAWHVPPPAAVPGRDWFGLHPRVGEAVMSTLAIAIARDKGLDIVTSEGRPHHALVTLDDEEAFSDLLGLGHPTRAAGAADKVDELAEVLFTTCFDLDRLGAEEIAELLKEGKDLRRFKQALVPFAQQLPDIPNVEDRQERFEEKALEVVDSWQEYKKSLPRFALDALIDTTDIQMPAIASSLLGGATALGLTLGTGAAIGLMTCSGLKIWRKYQEAKSSPLQYLTQVTAANATLVLPPGPRRGEAASEEPSDES